MFVKRTTDIEDVLKVVPVEVKLREKEKTHVHTKEFLAFVQPQLQNPYFYFLMFFEDESEKNLMGYMALLAIPIKLMDMQQINVFRVYYDPKYRHTGIAKKGWEVVESIARHHKIKDVRIEVMRGEKAYMRRWGFKKRSTVLERRVE